MYYYKWLETCYEFNMSCYLYLDRYRATVLRCLPNLENLDGEDVQPEEVDHAMQHGLILQHPLSAKRVSRNSIT